MVTTDLWSFKYFLYFKFTYFNRKEKKEELFPNPAIYIYIKTVIFKPNKNSKRKEKYSSFSFMNVNIKSYTNNKQNITMYKKRKIHHYQEGHQKNASMV